MSEGDASEMPEDGAEEPAEDETVETEESGTTQGETDGAGASTDGPPGDLDDVLAMGDGPGDIEVGEDFVERIADADPEQLATEISQLRLRVESLESELAAREEDVEELEEKLKRKQADFQNYKKRMEKKREQEKQRATEDLVGRLLDVRDNLVRALEQDEDADIRDGIEATRRQFDEELRRENVEPVEPDPGADVDPQRHEVLLRVESAQPEGTIAEVHRPGYEMADKVIRSAQVTVSDGGNEDDDAEQADADSADEATETDA
jgi:molecular chaperone GrpE